MLTVECKCEPGEKYADGSEPEFYDDAQDARAAFIKAKFDNRLYWGVHLRGQHLVGRLKMYLQPVAP